MRQNDFFTNLIIGIRLATNYWWFTIDQLLAAIDVALAEVNCFYRKKIYGPQISVIV